MDPLVLGPLLKALVERLQAALALPVEVPVALDLVTEHPMVAALTAETQAMEHPMVTQVIAVLEAIALTAETRVMTDHPAMETVGPPVMGTAAVTAEVMAAVMAAVTAVGTAEATVVVMAEAMVAVMAVETSKPDDLVFKKLYGSP